MDTSLRYSGESKALRLHAKQKLSIVPNTHLQFHGELDTKAGPGRQLDSKLGNPSYLSGFIRHFLPDLGASMGVGVQYDKYEKLRYTFRGKKSFPVTSDGLVAFNVKGRYHLDKNFKEPPTAAAELSWSIFNFQKDQDVRIKFGYEVLEKLPYLQIRENNWTLNADMKGRWNVRFDL
ncbi:Outer envelope pore protein 21B, chloroplastic [Linum grandiflorum]